MSSLPKLLAGKTIWITFDDEDTAWIRDAAAELGAELVTSVTPTMGFVIAQSLDEAKEKLKGATTDAKLLSKSWLLDTIAETRLPASMAPYFLDPTAKNVSDDAEIGDLQEDLLLLPRKQDAKRRSIDDPLLPLDAPHAKRPSTLPASSSNTHSTSASKQDSSHHSAPKSHHQFVPRDPSSNALAFPPIPDKPMENAGERVPFAQVGMKWEKVDGSVLSFFSPNLRGSPYIAAFDMDHTLIVPKSGQKFPNNRYDWKWMLPEVPTMLKKLYALGFNIVIFSNQNGIAKGKQNASDITGKIEDMCADVGIPMQAFCACESDKYRKPSPEMFNLFATRFNGGVVVDRSKSFYIGDAAGRPLNWVPKRKADHGVVDRKFAWNCSLPFRTPEEFFLGHSEVTFQWRSVNPHQVLGGTVESTSDTSSKSIEKVLGTLGKKFEMIVMMGCPASGKSTFAVRELEARGYKRVNRDLLGDANKCKSAAKAALAAGKSVVVDNTNPAASTRAEYIALAKQFGAAVRAFHMTTDRELADHCNLYRERLNGTKRIPDVAYNLYKKNFQPPTEAEGFDEIVHLPWIPQFDSEQDRHLFLQWTE